jgi:hypothetical protein
MRAIIISPAVREKIETKHQVSEKEVCQCFENLYTPCVEDIRAEHKTDPASLCFIAETDRGRLLKVVFVNRDGNIHLKTAFPPDEADINFYQQAIKNY